MRSAPIVAVLLITGCGASPLAIPDAALEDLAVSSPDQLSPDLTVAPNLCGFNDPNCVQITIGSSGFPFGGDPGSDPAIIAESDHELELNGSGYLQYSGGDLQPWPSYSLVLRGCQEAGQPMPTKWIAVAWDAYAPPMTMLAVQARSGNVPVPDGSWGPYTDEAYLSPFGLANGNLTPNFNGDGYLQLNFIFQATPKLSPQLKSLYVLYECPT